MSRNRFAARSTIAGGGVSLMNRRASFVAMKRAVDAQRVELHQLAGVVLVEPSPSPGSLVNVRIDAHPVVEIEEHRGALGRRLEQIAKFSKNMRTDDVPFVFRQKKPIAALSRVDVEMVEPEVGEDFLQLPIAVDGADDLLLR